MKMNNEHIEQRVKSKEQRARSEEQSQLSYSVASTGGVVFNRVEKNRSPKEKERFSAIEPKAYRSRLTAQNSVDFIAIDFSQRIGEQHIKSGIHPHSMWLKPLKFMKSANRQLKQTAIKLTAIRQMAIEQTAINSVISTIPILSGEEKSVAYEMRFPARMNWSGGLSSFGMTAHSFSSKLITQSSQLAA